MLVNNIDISGFKDTVSEQLTDPNGLANVILYEKSKGIVTTVLSQYAR